jgi:hypothetical protein
MQGAQIKDLRRKKEATPKHRGLKQNTSIGKNKNQKPLNTSIGKNKNKKPLA